MICLTDEWKARLTVRPPGCTEGFFTNARRQALPYFISEPVGPSQGVVLIVPGMGEPREKYYEMLADLNRLGVRAAIFDRMGQGGGGRYLANTHKMHARRDSFDGDGDDIIQFVQEKFPGQRVTMMAHSTGALPALLAYAKKSDLFGEPVLSSPLLGIQDRRVSGWETWIAYLRPLIPQRLQEDYVHGGRNWRQRGKDGLKPPDRYSGHETRSLLRDYWNIANPELQIGDTTVGWLLNACAAISRIINPEFLKTLGPLTILTAGQDILVDNKRVSEIIPQLRDVSRAHYADAKHELPFEIDLYRDELINRIVASACGEKYRAPNDLPSANDGQYDRVDEQQLTYT